MSSSVRTANQSVFQDNKIAPEQHVIMLRPAHGHLP